MPWQDYIFKKQVQDYAGSVDEVNAFVISKIYLGSLAASLPLQVGYLYQPAKPKSKLHSLKNAYEAQGMDYIFFSPDKKKRTTIQCKTFPFGLKLRKTVLGLCADLEAGHRPDFEAAAQVVHEGNDQDFLKIAVAASQNEALAKEERSGIGGLMALLRPDNASMLKTVASNDNRGASSKMRPEYFFMAAYLAFKGRSEIADSLLPDEHDFNAIYQFGGGVASLYYLAKGYNAQKRLEVEGYDGEMEGVDVNKADPVDAIFMFGRAFDLSPDSQRLVDLLEQMTGQRPSFEPEEPEQFYSTYSFPAHDPQILRPVAVQPSVSSAQTIEGLKKGEYLLVILLGLYRANGFYSRAMTLLTQLYPLIGKRFPHIHIITAYEGDTLLKPKWLAGESFAQECGLPLSVLFDQDNEICEEMEVNASPHGLIIDHTGMIIHRSALDEEEGYWHAITLVGQADGAHKPNDNILTFPS